MAAESEAAVFAMLSFDSVSPGVWAAGAGLLGGAVLGLAARLGRFCSVGAVEDALYAEDDRRLRAWAMAAGVAVLLVFALEASGAADLTQARFLTWRWDPAATVVGGVMFGYGMAIAGFCGFGALARLGGGDLRGLVVAMVIGVTAAAAAGGVFGAIRGALFPIAHDLDGAAGGLAHRLGAALDAPAWPIALAAGLALLAAALWAGRRPLGAANAFWAAAAGAAVASGFAATAWLEAESLGAVRIDSHSFTAPMSETVLYAMVSSGLSLSFGVGSVVGVPLGAAVGALWRGEFRWEACDDARELRRHMFGAALMGVGGVIAFGCTVGQGLSAFALLAPSAPLAVTAMGVGAWLGLRGLVAGLPALGRRAGD